MNSQVEVDEVKNSTRRITDVIDLYLQSYIKAKPNVDEEIIKERYIKPVIALSNLSFDREIDSLTLHTVRSFAYWHQRHPIIEVDSVKGITRSKEDVVNALVYCSHFYRWCLELGYTSKVNSFDKVIDEIEALGEDGGIAPSISDGYNIWG